MPLEKDTEEKIRELVLEKIGAGGRQNWDIPHTLCAVKWMKRLIGESGGDERVLVPAMYFHDSCYPSYEAGYSYEESREMKKLHARRGAEFARKTLEGIGGFTREEAEEICRLVEKHDIHNDIVQDDLNRQLVFEADGLAQLDWEDCLPNFNKENCLKWIKKYFEVERPIELWRTELGRRSIKELKDKNGHYWDNK